VDFERANGNQRGGGMSKVAIVLVPLLVLAHVIGAVGCDGGNGEGTATPPLTPTLTQATEPTPIPTTEVECPVTCSADAAGWEVVFECEEEGQSVKKTYYEGYGTTFKDGEPYVHGDVGFEFQTSGNVYRVTVDIEPCTESSTGYCITVEATGSALGNEPVNCQNF
jgi:hypothetical protein